MDHDLKPCGRSSRITAHRLLCDNEGQLEQLEELLGAINHAGSRRWMAASSCRRCESSPTTRSSAERGGPPAAAALSDCCLGRGFPAADAGRL
jgi:hypothetical protein